MYLDHEGNRTGDISPTWGQPNTKVHTALSRRHVRQGPGEMLSMLLSANPNRWVHFWWQEYDSVPWTVKKRTWKQLLKIFGPELIRINSFIGTARSTVLKRGFFFWRRQPQIFENVTLVARRNEHFRVFLAKFLVAQLPTQRGVLGFKNSLASYQRCRHSIEPCALTCPFKQSNLSAWSFLNL